MIYTLYPCLIAKVIAFLISLLYMLFCFVFPHFFFCNQWACPKSCCGALLKLLRRVIYDEKLLLFDNFVWCIVIPGFVHLIVRIMQNLINLNQIIVKRMKIVEKKCITDYLLKGVALGARNAIRVEGVFPDEVESYAGFAEVNVTAKNKLFFW